MDFDYENTIKVSAFLRSLDISGFHFKRKNQISLYRSVFQKKKKTSFNELKQDVQPVG